MPVPGMEMEAAHVLPYTRSDLEKSENSLETRSVFGLDQLKCFILIFDCISFSRYT